MCVRGYLVYLRFYGLSIIFMNCSDSVFTFLFFRFICIYFFPVIPVRCVRPVLQIERYTMFLQTILGILTSRRLLKSNLCDLSVISVKRILRKKIKISRIPLLYYTILLSVLLRFTVSDYAFGIFKLFLYCV